jgi:hypothetical protein
MGWSFRDGDISGLGDHLGHAHPTALDDLLSVVVSENEPTPVQKARRRWKSGSGGEQEEGRLGMNKKDVERTI